MPPSWFPTETKYQNVNLVTFPLVPWPSEPAVNLLIPSPSPAWAGSGGAPYRKYRSSSELWRPSVTHTAQNQTVRESLPCLHPVVLVLVAPGTVAVPPFGKATRLGPGDGHPRPSQSCRCSGLQFHEVLPRVRASRNSVSDIPVLS